jgi:copper chaperone CopZ
MKKILFLLPFVFACQGPKTTQPAAIETNETVITYNLVVEGMTCTGCENTIENGLTTIDGVKTVTASHESGIVTVSLDPEKADTTAIRAKISETGYSPVSSFKLTE